MEKIVFYPGPLHLFWTTGVYYLWELSQEFEAVLILDIPSEDDCKRIERLRKSLPNLIDVVYFNNKKKYFASHKECYEISKKIIDKYKPKFIFSNNDLYKFNVYLLSEGKKYHTINICYLSGIDMRNAEFERKLILQSQIIEFSKKYKIPYFLAKIFKIFELRICHCLNYYIMPICIGHPPFIGKSSAYLRKGTKCMRDGDIYIVRSLEDRENSINEGLEENKIKVFNHPIKRIDTQLANEVIYGKIKETDDIITVFPSWGNTEFAVKRKSGEKLSVDQIYDSWVRIISALSSKFPEYKIYIKLHPVQRKDVNLIQLFENLKSNFPKLNLIYEGKPAIYYILKSKIVVAETSTVLYTASILDLSKVIISFDINRVILGDYYQGEPNIYYFDNIDKFLRFDFQTHKPLLDNNIDRNELINFLKHY